MRQLGEEDDQEKRRHSEGHGLPGEERLVARSGEREGHKRMNQGDDGNKDNQHPDAMRAHCTRATFPGALISL